MIKQDTAGAGSSRRGGRLRGALVGTQVALCMALMIAAGLLLRGLYTKLLGQQIMLQRAYIKLLFCPA